MTARHLHRSIALGLAVFLALHLGNHLAGLFGQDTHRAVQAGLRMIYRNPLIEAALLAAFAAQAILGLLLLSRRRKMTLQTVSGAYLAMFILVHIGAVMTGRWNGVDTDLAFAAAGLHASFPWPLVFAPYYGLAVLSIFVHLSVPIGRRHRLAGQVTLGAGALAALALVLLLAGAITPLRIPAELIAVYP